MRSFAVLAVLCWTSAPSFAADLVVTTEPNGSLLIKDGDHRVAHFVPKTPASQRGAVVAKSMTTAGHRLVEARLSVTGDPPARQELWLAEQTATGVDVVFSGLVGPQDADGETAVEVRVSDGGIETFQTSRRISRCDGQPAPLFRKQWSFAGRKFVSASDLPPPSKLTVQAHRGGAPAGKGASGFFFSAASSSAGVGGEASRLKPPAAVNDDDADTVWVGGGDARGQTLTARSSGGFPIIGVRILPGDTRSEKAYRASAKPHRLVLMFGKDAAQNVDVELVDEPDGGGKRYREPFWIVLPKPVQAACVSVIVRDATSDQTPLAIANLTVMTELDGPNAVDRLVADLARAESCVGRTSLLTSLGPSALAKVAGAIPKTAAGPGRICLVQALSELLARGEKATPEAAAALVSTLDGASPEEEKAVLSLLPTMAGVSVSAIAAVLRDEKRSDDDRVRAARVLARMQTSDAAAALVAAVGNGSSAFRKALRVQTSTAKTLLPAAVLDALKGTPPSQPSRRADLVWVAAALAGLDAASTAAVRSTLATIQQSNASFEERARAIQGLGMLKDPAALADLAEIRAHGTDGVLRSLAIAELATFEGAEVLPALRDALSDADPRVREAAAEALGRRNDRAAAPKLLDGAKQEPWPSVRRAEIAALGELCVPEGNALLIRAFQRDSEDVRQAALVGIDRCYGPKATGTLLRTLGRLPESADMRSLAARLLGGRKDPRLLPGLKEVLKRLLRESEADLSLEAVVADTAVVLADLRTPEAISALVSLLSDARPSIKRIAIDILGMVCDPEQGAAALRSASASKDDAIAIPAAAAERNCRDRRAP